MNTEAPVKAPVRTPEVSPSPIRRLYPDEVCPSQKERIVRRVRRIVP